MNRTEHHKQPVIFCDFDGTITENDNIVAIMKHFQPPGWENIVEQIIGREISIKEGVGALFALLPTSNQEEIVHFAIENAKIRQGFQELLHYCEHRRIPFYVTSGGIDFFVYPLLQPFSLRPEQIYCNQSDFAGETIRIVWPHPCDEYCDNKCGMCKTRIIRSYDSDQYYRILIGDSITDFEGAKLADLVFARSHLLERCAETGIPYIPYETFYDVIEHLEKEAVPVT
jgi:2-hydroxy-3-keto-5-methylthiopentenyl-1-phosphate phosphatase